MRKKAQKIVDILEGYFPHPEVPLLHSSPYTLLICVLLSAQCTDERVNKIAPLLFEKANTPYEMVKLEVSEIQTIIRPCGLSPKKSRAIYELSQILIESYEGEVPQSLEALEELPGVGHKTASVVMSQAFNQDHFPIDTHIHRLAKRWGLSDGRSVVQTERDLKKAFPKKLWNKLHLQIIYFGRAFCPARGHDPKACPICAWASPD